MTAASMQEPLRQVAVVDASHGDVQTHYSTDDTWDQQEWEGVGFHRMI